jgi:cysteine desulfurase/selenocysteine lyase
MTDPRPMRSSVYLDYAATSAIRPPEVVEAMVAYLTDIGATPGRSGHQRSIKAGRVALRARRLLAELLGIEGDPGRIAFQLNATHALNTAIFGILAAGARVVRTRYDHNAVRRPVAALVRGGVEEDLIEVDESGLIDFAQVDEVLRGGAKPPTLVVLTHASNVTGVVLPVRELADRAHEAGALVLVDLAQTAGHYPVDLGRMAVDMAAFPGHKGLLGPQGIGALWVREGVDVLPLLLGGTGGDSLPSSMPDAYPDHLEAGTQNAPGMAGLAAGVEWVLARGVANLHTAESKLKSRLLAGLATVRGLRVCSPKNPDDVGIVTVVHEWLTPGELAVMVERSHGIQGRAGLHCAPDAHAAMGTLREGAFRLSLGWASTESDVDAAIAAFRELASAPKDD